VTPADALEVSAARLDGEAGNHEELARRLRVEADALPSLLLWPRQAMGPRVWAGAAAERAAAAADRHIAHLRSAKDHLESVAAELVRRAAAARADAGDFRRQAGTLRAQEAARAATGAPGDRAG
jgi:hypothetical protein